MAAGALLAVPSSAQAAERVVAGPSPNTYLIPNVAIDRGEALTFLNADPLGAGPHNVTSVKTRRVWRRGRWVRRPLFRSATVGAPKEVPVNGVARLAAGRYPFFCTLHAWMTGALRVR
jgi:plastocyanin